MATSPDKASFLNKLAKFVTNPTTDWKQLESGIDKELDENGPSSIPVAVLSQVEQAQLHRQRRKRDRRVREREFDLLRKIQKDRNATVVQEAFQSTLLNRTSQTKIEKNEAAEAGHVDIAPSGFNVTQINRIEKQMADQWWAPEPEADPALLDVKTQLLMDDPADGTLQGNSAEVQASADMIAFDAGMLDMPAASPMAAEAVPAQGESIYTPQRQSVQTAPLDWAPTANEPSAYMQTQQPEAPLPDAATSEKAGASAFGQPAEDRQPAISQSVQELPDFLHEPSILFAQGKYRDTEASLLQLMEQSGDADLGAAIEGRLALLDLYRATRAEAKFDAVALELVQRFGRSAPQYWQDAGVTLHHASSTSMHASRFSPDTQHGQQHWTCPAVLDMMAVLLLRSQMSRTTPEILLDWRGLRQIEEAALQPLLDQLRSLAECRVELIMWGGRHLLAYCSARSEEAKDGERMLYWLLRLELVRLMGRQEDFDSLALEYCLALEESPPSWVRIRCDFVDADADMELLAEDPSTSPAVAEDGGAKSSGNMKHPLLWTGDILGAQKDLFEAAEHTAAHEPLCEIDCMGLDRMDYLAASDLLVWLMGRAEDAKEVRFVHVHRLLAVFWRIMGIATKARVELRHD